MSILALILGALSCMAFMLLLSDQGKPATMLVLFIVLLLAAFACDHETPAALLGYLAVMICIGVGLLGQAVLEEWRG